MADLKQVIQELNAEISAENPTVSRVLEDGSLIVSYGDGRFALSKPGESRYALYDTAGNLQGFESQRDVRGGVEYTTFNTEGKQIDQRVASTTPGLAGILAPIALTAMGAGYLGPAGAGLLSTPAAAATSAGGMTLFQGGSAEDALKNAALAGALGYGIENLFPSDALTAGRTAVDLAGAGQTIDDITQTLVNQGVSSSTARTIAAEALAGSSASQIASDFAGLTLGGAGSTSLASPAATNPNLVNVLGSTAPAAGPGLLSSVVSAAPAVIPAVVSNTSTTQTTEQPPPEQVNVQALRQAKINDLYQSILGRAPDAAGLAFYSNPDFTEAQIEADIRNSPEAKNRVVVTAPPVAPPVAPTSTIISSTVPAVVSAPAPAPAPSPAPAPAPAPSEPKPTSLFNPADILKLLGLLGGIGAGSALTGPGSSTTTPTVLPPSNTMIGSTTPQFGPDYYAAVQQYYNAYMPQTPRNVATPLQQWYENKFGA